MASKENNLVINIECLTEGTTVLYNGREFIWHEGLLYNEETNTCL